MKLQRRTRTLFFRLVLLGAYTTTGAAIFHVIESGRVDEENFCNANGKSKVEFEMAKTFNVSMQEIRRIVVDLCQRFEEYYHRNQRKYSHNDWSYYQSLYFVGSVTTTIGYGHLAPKTQYGRLFLIFYAMIGIPLNLLTLQSVGEYINIAIHFLVKFVETTFFKNSTVRHEHVKIFLLSIVFMVLMLPIGGLMYYYSEKENGWTYLDSVYYCFVALSTIGFGDLVPNEGKEPDSTYERVMWFIRLLYLGLGLSLVSSVFTSVSSATKQLRMAFSCKKGKYKLSRRCTVKASVSINFKKTTCIAFKELFSTRQPEPTSSQYSTTSDEAREGYLHFDDTASVTSTSIVHSHANEAISIENSIELESRRSGNDEVSLNNLHRYIFDESRYRSVSDAYNDAKLAENTFDTESCSLPENRARSATGFSSIVSLGNDLDECSSKACIIIEDECNDGRASKSGSRVHKSIKESSENGDVDNYNQTKEDNLKRSSKEDATRKSDDKYKKNKIRKGK